MSICPSCERRFGQALPSHHLCRVCWAEKNGDLDLAFAEVAWNHGFDAGYGRGLLDGRKRGRDESRTAMKAMLADIPLRNLILLCHPDRHPAERASLANEVTQWLNGLREVAEEAA